MRTLAHAAASKHVKNQLIIAVWRYNCSRYSPICYTGLLLLWSLPGSTSILTTSCPPLPRWSEFGVQASGCTSARLETVVICVNRAITSMWHEQLRHTLQVLAGLINQGTKSKHEKTSVLSCSNTMSQFSNPVLESRTRCNLHSPSLDSSITDIMGCF